VDPFEIALRVAGLLATLSAGAFGVIYARRVQAEAAQTRLGDIQKDTISALESRMRLLETTIESRDHSLEQCERQRQAAESALAAWHELGLVQ